MSDDAATARFLDRVPQASDADAVQCLSISKGDVNMAVSIYRAMHPKAEPTAQSTASFFETLQSNLRAMMKKANSEGSALVTAVMLGETGSGKSSFVNLFMNAFRVKSPSELVDRIDHGKDNQASETGQSVTDGCTMYTIDYPGFGKLQLLDTPGFGDTRGVEITEQHVNNVGLAIADLAAVNCLILVVNGKQPRATATVNYVLTSLGMLLPEAARQNVIVVATNTKDALDANLPIKLITEGAGLTATPAIFYLENPLGAWANAAKKNQLRDPEILKAIDKRFEEAQKVCVELTTKILSLKAHPTKEFATLREAQEKATIAIARYLDQSSAAEAQRIKINGCLANIKTFIDSQEKNKNFTVDVEVVETHHTPGTPNTLCLAPGCASNCHAPCGLPLGANIQGCAVIAGGEKCKVCNHSFQQHQHFEYYRKKVVKKQNNEAIKAAYDRATSEKEKENLVVQGLQEQLRTMEANVATALAEAKQAIDVLRSVASQKSFLKFLHAKRDVVKEEMQNVDPKTFSCPRCGVTRNTGVLLGSCGEQKFHVLCDDCSKICPSSCPVCSTRREAAKEKSLTPAVVHAQNPQLQRLKALLQDIERTITAIQA